MEATNTDDKNLEAVVLEVSQRLNGAWRLAILTYLRDHGESSTRELMDGLQTSRQQLVRPLRELREWGWIAASVRQPELRPIVFALDHERIRADLAPYQAYIQSL